MYETRFGLKRRPFPPTPDSTLYYPATPHEQALAPLLRAISGDEGLALLLGEPGTGKTLLGHVFLERLGTDIVSAFVPNSHLSSRADLHRSILFDLGLPYDDANEHVLRLRLTEQALKACGEGKRLVVVIDEAHLLASELLEELRLLGNLEAGRKAFQTILVAQSSILETLKQPKLAALSQRLAVRVFLPALTAEDAHDYLIHQLRIVGGRPEKMFDEDALQSIARASRGVPRLLNQAAHQALLLADASDLNHVDVECAVEALTLLGLETSDTGEGDSSLEPVLDLRAVDPETNLPRRRSA